MNPSFFRFSLTGVLTVLAFSKPALGAELTLGGKLGHQSVRLESSSVKAVEVLSSSQGIWGEQLLSVDNQAPFRTGLKNGPVAGVRMSLIDSYWAASGELDYAQFAARPGSSLGIYSLSLMGELNLIKQPWIRVYSLAGISFRSIETSRRLSQDFVDKEEVVKTEPILTMNHDLGLGVEVPLNKDLTLGFAYRSSQSMTADGQYRQEIRQTDSFGARVLSSETRAEYKDFRYQMREFVISLSLQSSSQN